MCRSSTALLAALLASSSADAFVVHPQINQAVRRLAPVSALYDKEGHHIAINPMDGFKGVDLERARVCAEHFGECTVEEMEVLKSSKFLANALLGLMDNLCHRRQQRTNRRLWINSDKT